MKVYQSRGRYERLQEAQKLQALDVLLRWQQLRLEPIISYKPSIRGIKREKGMALDQAGTYLLPFLRDAPSIIFHEGRAVTTFSSTRKAQRRSPHFFCVAPITL